MSGVEWIKINVDMFDNRKIKHLRKLPEGNNIVLIWVMLLTLAGRCNAGGMIFLTENIAYTPKMLADELGFEESTVCLALDALETLGMIGREGFITIEGWAEHQNIDGLEKIREQNRIRKQRQREREKLLLSDGHVTVTGSHATDIDIDKDKEKNKSKSNKRFTPPTKEEVQEYCKSRNNHVDAERFVDYYTSNGWMVGRNKMKDWKSAVRTWERNSYCNKRIAPAETDEVLDGIL